MCVEGCQQTVVNRLSRRGFLKASLAAAAATAVSTVPTVAAGGKGKPPIGGPIREVIDLTHTMTEDFPTYFGAPQLEVESMFTFENDGFNANRWILEEHTGTHMDAPIHFSADQHTADEVPIENLVVPLVVVDIRHKAAGNDDAQLTPDDLMAWEHRYGRIPEGACVAMYSGWEQYLGTPKFRNADANGVMHFPGFHAEAALFLMEERIVNGIAVDTLSLDYGQSGDFATHYSWLPSNRWGMENVANLGECPAKGATFVAGGPKIAGASGGMSRCIALVHKRPRH